MFIGAYYAFAAQKSPSLSFSVAATAFGFTSGTGVIWLDNVQCEGNESRLIDCPANQLGFHNCVHSRDVAVACSATACPYGAIRLAGGAAITGKVNCNQLHYEAIPCTSL